MTRAIWNGKGDAGDSVTFTGNNGVVRGRPYVRSTARRMLKQWPLMDTAKVDAILAATVDNDQWLATMNGQTPASVGRCVVDAWLSGGVAL